MKTKNELIAERDEVRGQYETNRRHQVSLAVKLDALEKQIENYVDEAEFIEGQAVLVSRDNEEWQQKWYVEYSDFLKKHKVADYKGANGDLASCAEFTYCKLDPSVRTLEFIEYTNEDIPEEGVELIVVYKDLSIGEGASINHAWDAVELYAIKPDWLK